jgi:predicted CXXCH cytochrome family protein
MHATHTRFEGRLAKWLVHPDNDDQPMRKLLIATVILSIVAGSIYTWVMVPPPSSDPPSNAAQSATPTSSDRSQSAADASRASGNGNRDAQATGSLIPVAAVSDDPRLNHDSIFRNIDPQVKYVGDSNCAQCHDAICTTFHAHPMGRSAVLAGSDSLEQTTPEAHNPCQVGPYQLSVRIEDGKMVHALSATTPDGEQLPAIEFPVSIAIGSGTRGRSYLNIDGDAVWQSPISWYTTKMRWDLSPGYDLGLATQRPTVTACLYCHVNQHEPIPDSVNRYRLPLSPTQLSIGCERCHGPGELHSYERTHELPMDAAHPGVDTSIVNPAHLSEALQMSICAQCHLSGRTRVQRRGRSENEFRPGLPWELFVNAFVSAPEAQFKNKAVGHFDQMQQSKCRSVSGGRLVCTSCHDPHQATEPETSVRFYNDTCIACHVQQPCNAPEAERQQQNDNCIHCHMPQNGSTNIAHTSFTDHRILRSPSAKSSGPTTNSMEVPLLPYSADSLPREESERDLGIALARYSEKLQPGTELRKRVLGMAKERLTESLERWPDDVDAWLAMCTVGVGYADAKQAFAAAENAYKVAPKNEDVLVQLAYAAEVSGQLERSQRALNELLLLNPTSQDYRLKRMASLVAIGDWYEAETASRELLQLNPLQPTAHMVLGLCLYGDGNKAAGRRQVEIALLLATTPQQRASIQGWFDRFVAWRAKSE